MEKIILPQAFVANMKMILGNEYSQFESSMYEAPPISIRLNSGIKLPNHNSGFTSSGTQFSIFNSQFSIPWSEGGRYLFERPSFTLDPLFHAGSYYVQEAASMFIEQCANTVRQYGDIDYILDLCAAPGGKSTHLISLFPDSLVVCNEVIRSRVTILQENISKWGRANTMITSCDPSEFHQLGHFFDFILVDAPCSGEGMFRKDPEVLKEWSPEHVKHCTARQLRIVRDVWDALKPGGFMLYGTCTYNIEENENVVKYITQNLGAESIPVDTSMYEEISSSLDDNIYACRFFPHKTKSEGLFFALVRKTTISSPAPLYRKGGKSEMKMLCKGERKGYSAIHHLSSWINAEKDMFAGYFPRMKNNHLSDCSSPLLRGAGREVSGGEVYIFPTKFLPAITFIHRTLYTLSFGVTICTIKGNDYIPSHSFAHSVDINVNNFIVWEVNRIIALKYLRREILSAPSGTGKGYVLLTYLGVPLGWVKNIGVRCNNMLPQNRKINNRF
ncbi:MAG: rRNA cytosine-C5-methyltransferase [Prevotellaceae bacterium]|jgi:16S rRNA C967 or C1407 C5-methylase (RsmB/RsmF family)/NOL1/NOP2/fmu family ribosome biogenesis protein|nr:rRNA cytosine-C5-methyltransferase [Prevotellaceae bacterium]